MAGESLPGSVEVVRHQVDEVQVPVQKGRFKETVLSDNNFIMSGLKEESASRERMLQNIAF